MKQLRIVFGGLTLLAVLALPVAAVSSAPTKGYSATAEFLVNPTGCHETYAEVVVHQTDLRTQPGRPTAAVTVEVIYNVVSTCEEGDYLFYYEFHTEGPVTIPAQDFDIQSGLQWATLDTTVPVFDEESGSHTTLDVLVYWTATGKSEPQARTANATLEVAAPYVLGYHAATSIDESVSAELRKLR